MKSNSGLTLIELLIVVVLVAVLATFAVPAFLGSGSQPRVDQVASELAEVLKLARTEASRRGRAVYLSSSNQGVGWQSWSPGWFLWADESEPKDGVFQSNDAQVVVKQNTHNRLSITPTVNNLSRVQFGAGFAPQFTAFNTNTITFMVCEDNSYVVRVQLQSTGNVQVLGPLDAPVLQPADFTCPNRTATPAPTP